MIKALFISVILSITIVSCKTSSSDETITVAPVSDTVAKIPSDYGKSE